MFLQALSVKTTVMMKMMLAVIFVCAVSFTTHVSAQESCPNCGGMEVPYPLSTDNSCGHPNYRVYCNNGALEFSSAEGFHYKILSINPSAYKLVIRPPMIQEGTCLSTDLSVGGFRIDDNSPFNISTHNTVMLFNCSENLLLSPLNCSSNSICRQFEEGAEEGRGCRNTLCCSYLKDSAMTSHRIRARVEGCTAYTSVVDIKPGDLIESWNYGVELQWLPLN